MHAFRVFLSIIMQIILMIMAPQEEDKIQIKVSDYIEINLLQASCQCSQIYNSVGNVIKNEITNSRLRTSTHCQLKLKFPWTTNYMYLCLHLPEKQGIFWSTFKKYIFFKILFFNFKLEHLESSVKIGFSDRITDNFNSTDCI